MSIVLRTARLVLRGWRDGDREPFAEMCADPEITEWLLPLNRAASDAWIARMQAHCAQFGFRALDRLTHPRAINGPKVRGLNFFSRAEQTLLAAPQRPGLNIVCLHRAV